MLEPASGIRGGHAGDGSVQCGRQGLNRSGSQPFWVSTVLAAAARRAVLIFDQQGSMGEKSGEYRGRYLRVKPASSMASLTALFL